MSNDKFLNKKIKKFHMNILASQFLNIHNLERISKHKIREIENHFNNKEFYEYKRKLLYKWDKIKNDSNFLSLKIDRFKKYAKKLNIKLIDKDINYINNLEAINFTKTRNLKSVEVPYQVKKQNLSPYAYFIFKNTSLYSLNGGIIFNLITKGDLYITRTEILIYNSEKNEIMFLLYRKNTKKINSLKYAIELIDNSNNKFYIRNYEIRHIPIATQRLWKDKKLFN